jgi:hypothetical protein
MVTETIPYGLKFDIFAGRETPAGYYTKEVAVQKIKRERVVIAHWADYCTYDEIPSDGRTGAVRAPCYSTPRRHYYCHPSSGYKHQMNSSVRRQAKAKLGVITRLVNNIPLDELDDDLTPNYTVPTMKDWWD